MILLRIEQARLGVEARCFEDGAECSLPCYLAACHNFLPAIMKCIVSAFDEYYHILHAQEAIHNKLHRLLLTPFCRLLQSIVRCREWTEKPPGRLREVPPDMRAHAQNPGNVLHVLE